MLEASAKTKWKVGLFTVITVLIFGYLSVYVNNHPFWWRSCEMINVTVEDATGLKAKTPVKTLGLDIGYVKGIALLNNGVQIRICVTAPVDIYPDTRAYVRSEGFLGDKFLELKPVRYLGSNSPEEKAIVLPVSPSPTPAASPAQSSSLRTKVIRAFFELWIPNANAQGKTANKEVPVAEKSADVQQVMNQVNGLMIEVKSITTSLKESINPEEIRGAVKQLNKTLENAAKIISPEGSLSSSAQRSLLKLEDAIDQLRDQVTKINQGQGSLGKLLNDPVYADELQKALVNMNKLLNRANAMRLIVNLGIQNMPAHDGSRAAFEVAIWTKPDRYYLLGMVSDPRGSVTQTTTITQVGSSTPTTIQSTKIEKGGFGITGMIGRVFYQRFDLSLGLIYGDGAASLKFNLGPEETTDMLQIANDLYFRSKTDAGTWTVQPDFRSRLIFQPFSVIYLTAGIEGVRKVSGQLPFLYGAGIRFDDDDIKLLFSFL